MRNLRGFILLFLLCQLVSLCLVLVNAGEESSSSSPRTGSWQNCTSVATKLDDNINDHPDSGVTTISCNQIHYRIPKSSLQKIDHEIVIGVLSGASTKGRRTSIRSTWAYRKKNVFFIVAGPWDEIKQEYDEFGDLLWINREEVYVTETSVLTFKSESFFSIFYKIFMNDNHNNKIRYLLKTDDDSYIHYQKLREAVIDSHDDNIDYWGKCHDEAWKPHRNHEVEWQKKWYISYDVYPEPEYPPYCQGAGILLSKTFLDCAIGNGHAARVRYMPNEDVAIGMLAERCGIPTTDDARVWVRWDEEDGITMDGKIIQHYVSTENDMRLHHRSATGVRGPILLQ